METSALKATIRNAILDVRPEDVELFDIEGDILLEEAIAGRSALSADGDVQSRFGFHDLADVAASASKYVEIVIVTIEALKLSGFLKSKPVYSGENLATLRASWAGELQKTGLEEEKAELIARRFADDLLKAVAKES